MELEKFCFLDRVYLTLFYASDFFRGKKQLPFFVRLFDCSSARMLTITYEKCKTLPTFFYRLHHRGQNFYVHVYKNFLHTHHAYVSIVFHVNLDMLLSHDITFVLLILQSIDTFKNLTLFQMIQLYRDTYNHSDYSIKYSPSHHVDFKVKRLPDFNKSQNFAALFRYSL